MTPLDLPDEPRWVEAHGMAADPSSWWRALGGGAVAGNDAARLAVVYGEAEAAGVVALGAELRMHALLVTTDELAAALRDGGRRVARAILHTLPDEGSLPDLEGAAPLPAEASLAHVPEDLQAELALVRARGTTVWSTFVDGAAVAFAYAPWRSARWFDISVDTLAGSRQLGLGAIVAAAMIRDERTAGREPVWGADEDNAASLRLARRLGFVAVDELWVAPP